MSNPFLLPPQSVLSFSGGRTSGFMLRRTLNAFGGKLPSDRKVIFCNTGKEREETLEFVERCSQRRFALFDASRPSYAELLAIAQDTQEGPGWLWADKGNEIEECRCTD